MALVLMLHPRDHYDPEELTDELAAEMGVLSTHLARHGQALPHISRCRVYRIGDGGAHLHVWLVARPEGPDPTPRAVAGCPGRPAARVSARLAEGDAAIVVDALVASYGGRRGPAAN